MSMEDRLAKLKSLKGEGEQAKSAEQERQAVEQEQRAGLESERTQVSGQLEVSKQKLAELNAGLDEARGMDTEGFPEDVIVQIQAEIDGISEEFVVIEAEIAGLQERAAILDVELDGESTQMEEPSNGIENEGNNEEREERIMEKTMGKIQGSDKIPEGIKDRAADILKNLREKDPKFAPLHRLMDAFNPTLREMQDALQVREIDLKEVNRVLEGVKDGVVSINEVSDASAHDIMLDINAALQKEGFGNPASKEDFKKERERRSELSKIFREKSAESHEGKKRRLEDIISGEKEQIRSVEDDVMRDPDYIAMNEEFTSIHKDMWNEIQKLGIDK